MKETNNSFFQNKDCEYFPCHEGANPEDFNCMFCYCPLYALGKACGGNFTYTKSGKKSCSGCLVPHGEQGVDYILSKIGLLYEQMKNQEGEE